MSPTIDLELLAYGLALILLPLAILARAARRR